MERFGVMGNDHIDAKVVPNVKAPRQIGALVRAESGDGFKALLEATNFLKILKEHENVGIKVGENFMRVQDILPKFFESSYSSTDLWDTLSQKFNEIGISGPNTQDNFYIDYDEELSRLGFVLYDRDKQEKRGTVFYNENGHNPERTVEKGDAAVQLIKTSTRDELSLAQDEILLENEKESGSKDEKESLLIEKMSLNPLGLKYLFWTMLKKATVSGNPDINIQLKPIITINKKNEEITSRSYNMVINIGDLHEFISTPCTLEKFRKTGLYKNINEIWLSNGQVDLDKEINKTWKELSLGFANATNINEDIVNSKLMNKGLPPLTKALLITIYDNMKTKNHPERYTNFFAKTLSIESKDIKITHSDQNGGMIIVTDIKNAEKHIFNLIE